MTAPYPRDKSELKREAILGKSYTTVFLAKVICVLPWAQLTLYYTGIYNMFIPQSFAVAAMARVLLLYAVPPYVPTTIRSQVER